MNLRFKKNVLAIDSVVSFAKPIDSSSNLTTVIKQQGLVGWHNCPMYMCALDGSSFEIFSRRHGNIFKCCTQFYIISMRTKKPKNCDNSYLYNSQTATMTIRNILYVILCETLSCSLFNNKQHESQRSPFSILGWCKFSDSDRQQREQIIQNVHWLKLNRFLNQWLNRSHFNLLRRCQANVYGMKA